MIEEGRQARSGVRWVLGILGGTVLLILIVVGAAYYSGWMSNLFLLTRPSEYSARYYPDDTLFYTWFTLNPGNGQREQMQGIWDEMSEYSSFRSWRDDMEDSLRDEVGVDIEDDVLRWIGPELSFAIRDMDVDKSEVEAAMTFDVRDAAACKEFLLDWLDREVDTGAEFDRSSTGDFDVWANERNEVYYALSERLLIVATDDRFLDEILEMLEGSGEKSLHEDEYFKAARATLPSRRFMSAYLSGKRAGYVIEETEFGETLDPSVYDEFPEWLAASVGWIEDGVTLDVVVPFSENLAAVAIRTRPLSDPARLMPADTVGLLAFTFDPDLDNWREELREYDFSELLDDVDYMRQLDGSKWLSDAPFDPSNFNMAHMLDFGLMGFDIFTGIDLERDFFAYLGGEVVIGVTEFDYEAVSEDPERNAVDAVALLSYSKSHEADLAETMMAFFDWLSSVADLEIYESDVGAKNDAVMVEVDDDYRYSPGYVLQDGYLIAASTEGALARIIRLQNGGSDSLAEDSEYRRAVGYLSEEHDMQIYLNLQSLIEAGNSYETVLSKSQSRFLSESVGSLALVSTAEDKGVRFGMVLTLFPENRGK